MNLEFPFDEPTDTELDSQLERIDQELDALFLGEVAEALAAVRAAKRGDDAVVAA